MLRAYIYASASSRAPAIKFSSVHSDVASAVASVRRHNMDVPTTALAHDLHIKRLLIGLWQVADLEREGGLGLDHDAALRDLTAYVEAGLSTFDMADHYGSAELLVGELSSTLSSVIPLTKWVPKPGAIARHADAVDAAVKLSLSRLARTKLPLLQFHTWDYLDGPGRWLQTLKLLAAHEGVCHLGLTNVDTEHLRLADAEGIPIVSNQICFSLLDRRASGAMSTLCADKGVKLLAFGVLAGGLLTERGFTRRRRRKTSWQIVGASPSITDSYLFLVVGLCSRSCSAHCKRSRSATRRQSRQSRQNGCSTSRRLALLLLARASASRRVWRSIANHSSSS